MGTFYPPLQVPGTIVSLALLSAIVSRSPWGFDGRPMPGCERSSKRRQRRLRGKAKALR
jgi:hypothetical protein